MRFSGRQVGCEAKNPLTQLVSFPTPKSQLDPISSEWYVSKIEVRSFSSNTPTDIEGLERGKEIWFY